MKPYRLDDTVTLIRASPPFCASASSTALEKEEFPKGMMAMTKCRHAFPSTAPSSSNATPDFKMSALFADALVTTPRLPTEVHPTDIRNNTNRRAERPFFNIVISYGG